MKTYYTIERYWRVEIDHDKHTITFRCLFNGEEREYSFPHDTNQIKFEGDYVYLFNPDTYLQFKMENENTLIGDLFESDTDEHIEAIAIYEFE